MWCNCKKPTKKKEGEIWNKVQAIVFEPANPEATNMRYFISWDLGKSYLQLSWSEEQGNVVFTWVWLDSEIASEVWTMLINGFSEGILAGKWMTAPESGSEGTIDAEAVTLVQNIFDNPTEENKAALWAFIAERMEWIMWGDVNAFIITRNE